MPYKSQARSLLITLALVAIAGLTFACVPSTTVEQSWTSPIVRSQPPLQRIVTVFFSDNVTIRRAGEDQLARDLHERGVQATPSYMVLRDDELDDLNKVRSRLLGMGYDGVVTMRVVDRYQELDYAPTFDTYWGGAYPYFYSSGFYYGSYGYTETVVRVETTAFSLRTNQLVWSAITRTYGDELDDLIDDTSKVISSRLTKRGLAG